MSEFKERLLGVWVDGSDNPEDWRKRGMRNHILTAVKDGVSLYTAPATAQARSFPGAPYQEEPGVSYFFENAKGEMVRGFDGGIGGSPSVGTFDYFFAAHDLTGADWHAIHETAPKP